MNIKCLLGQTLTRCDNIGGDEIILETESGKKFRMYHQQDCCESVYIDDICGNLTDLVGAPLIQAEENSDRENPKSAPQDYSDESFTWTFYRFATVKGSVVIKWYGSSNGYYSESVNIKEVQ